MFTSDDIYRVYRLWPQEDHTMHKQLAGRFAVINNELWILEDYFGLLDGIHEGELDEESLAEIHHLSDSQYIDVVQEREIQNGSRPDLLNEMKFEDGQIAEDPQSKRPPSVWEYHRSGMEAPQTIEAASGGMLMNGQPLSDDEIRTIINNCKSGASTLRYKQGVDNKIKKMETVFQDLLKAEDEDLSPLMEKLKALQAAGHIGAEDLQKLHGAIYGDNMIQDVGNKKAYKDFLSRPKPGVHVMMDANDFKPINDELSHQHGDQAITHMGNAMREAMDETVGRDKGKLFRFGGDEFAAHVPTHEHAAQFARALRSKLEAIPPIGGTHKLSISLGMGDSPEKADEALNVHAKGAKQNAVAAITGKMGSRQKVRAPEAMYAHSLVPGREGPIPTGSLVKPHIPAPKLQVPPLDLRQPVQPTAAPAQPAAPAPQAPARV